jgi:WD40 repeat protein
LGDPRVARLRLRSLPASLRGRQLVSHNSCTNVFISYSHKDGAQLAQRLEKDLKAKNLNVWLDRHRLSGGASWSDEIEHALDNSDVVLALLTSGSYASDICRAEQLRSLRKRKQVIPLLAQSGAEPPLYLETKQYRDFTGARSYSAQLRLLLADITNGKNSASLKDQFRVTHVTAPPLPRNYIERTESLLNLRNAVIKDDPGPSIAITALRGMGGIGKTILAQALGHDEVVQHAFPDGIAWTTAGTEIKYDLITRMQEVRRAVGDQPAGKESELECINRYRSTMQDKAALVIVDDVWRTEDIEPFLNESLRSRLLFTTRNADIAAAVGAEEHTANLLTLEQSRALLARWANLTTEQRPSEAEDLIRECGQLPLAISMIGAMVRGKPSTSWRHAVHLLRTADLAKIKAQFPNYPHTDLLRTIQVSVDALDDTARQRYLALAVLLEDMALHPAVQQTLWCADELDAIATADQFISLSLAQRDGDNIHLHDLQLDYVRAQYPDREALKLIQGAVRLSSNIIQRDPKQFVSQMVGRLLPYQGLPAIKQFTASIVEGAPTPWLRSLQPALHPPGTALIRTLEGHSAAVNCVALSPDGRRAVSASEDNTLKVWDLETGRELRTLKGHSDSVAGVAVSPNGQRAVSASWDYTVKLWDLETGRELHSESGHFDFVQSVVMSPDGRWTVSASRDKALYVWDLESGRILKTLEGHSKPINSVALSADGRWAVSASADTTLKIWDLETGCELRTLKGHSDSVNGVAISSDGRRAVSASSDKTLKVWDLDTGRELGTLEGHSSLVRGVAMSPDGRRAVSASGDHTLKVWDLEAEREIRAFEGHSDSVNGVAISSDGRRAVSASSDKTLKVWDLKAEREFDPFDGHSDSVNRVAVSRDGRLAVSASSDKTLKVWDLETGHELRTLKGHSHHVNDVAVSPDGRRALSASKDKTVKVWDLQTGREIRTLRGHSDLVQGVAFSPDGSRAVSASWDHTLKVWDLETGRILRTLEGHSKWVSSVAVSPDGVRAVSASWDHTLKVWDLETGRILRTLEGHSNSVHVLAASPDGLRVVSASTDRTLKVWDLQTGREIHTMKSQSSSIRGIAVSPDGRRAASASWDNTLKLWEGGAPLATFSCDGPATCCAFLSNSEVIAFDATGRLHLLRLELKASPRQTPLTGST